MMKTMSERANEMLNDWNPETISLLTDLTAAGFSIRYGNNGEEKFTLALTAGGLTKFIEELLATDEAQLGLIAPDGKRVAIYLVLGNSPGEICCDYTCHDGLEAVAQAHYDKWENRKQPKIRAADRYPSIYGPKGGAK